MIVQVLAQGNIIYIGVIKYYVNIYRYICGDGYLSVELTVFSGKLSWLLQAAHPYNRAFTLYTI